MCTLPANFGDLVQHVTQPQRFLFAAAPTPAASRGVRLTLCDGPTLSETRGRPFVAPRAAVPQYACQFLSTLEKMSPSLNALLCCCCSDASSQPGCAVTLCDVRHCRRLGGGLFVAPRACGVNDNAVCTLLAISEIGNCHPSLNAPCLLLLDASSQRGCAGRHCTMARHSRRLGGGRLWLLGRRWYNPCSCLVFYSTVFFASRHDFCFW